MDISKWIQFNPKITVEQTTKKYFGKFLYKLVVYCPAGRLIDSKDSMYEALTHRREVKKSFNYGGYWGIRHNRDLDKADIDFLETMRVIRKNPAGFKLRVEEPRIQIYAGTEKELIELVNTQLLPFVGFIESVSGPADANAEAVLNSGAIIRKKDVGYRYKIILKDGRYSLEDKSALLTYLSQLGPETVKVSNTGFEMLKKSTGFIWNLYIYTNDPSISMFLNLMHPGIVLNCHELVVVE